MMVMASEIVAVAREFEVDVLLDLHESWGFFAERSENGTAFLGQTVTRGSGPLELAEVAAIGAIALIASATCIFCCARPQAHGPRRYEIIARTTSNAVRSGANGIWEFALAAVDWTGSGIRATTTALGCGRARQAPSNPKAD